MKLTEVLKQEHRVIEQVLDCLEALALESASNGTIEREPAAATLRFLRTFADACHHGKEEDRLFPAMVEKGVPRETGPIGVMCSEHETGRAAIASMAAALEEDDVSTFVGAAQSYVGLLRDHISKEDHILFPIADSVLDEAAQQALLDDFEQVEREDIGPGVHEELLGVANELAARYRVPTGAARDERPFTGCVHQDP